MWGIGYILVMLVFAGVFGTVYSYFWGTNKITAMITSAFGGIFGTVYNMYVDFYQILEAAFYNFFESGYIGYSLLLIGVAFTAFMLLIYIFATLTIDPRKIP